jgi:hypothetical protein
LTEQYLCLASCLIGGVCAVRVALPAIYQRATKRWMNRYAPAASCFPVPAAFEATHNPFGLERVMRIAWQSRWTALAAVVSVLVSVVLIHLAIQRPALASGPWITPRAVLLDCLFTLPLFLIALRVPAYPVSWWASSVVPGVLLGMGIWVSLASAPRAAGLAAVNLVLTVIAAWAGTIVVLGAMRIVARVARQSSVTSGLTQAGVFGLAAFSVYVGNAIKSPRALLLLAPAVIVVALLNVLLPRHPGAPRSMLLLRTFGRSRRSRRLMEQLVRHWLSVGPIYTVQGPDLASTTLEPRHLMETLLGRSQRRFVKSPSDVEAAWSRGMTRHRDGRYSLESLYCLDDTWRPSVEALVARVDYVVMDARGFAATNAGFAFEVDAVLRHRGLTGVALLTDEKTDRAALSALLAQAGWRGGAATHAVRSDGDAQSDVTALLTLLARKAG